jgi:ubiquinone/menaquinone biosynthesis C-methylase UbiE
MLEQSKSARRRYHDGNFVTRFFRGDGIDIGAGQDSLAQYRRQFSLMTSVRAWDVGDGDAQYLASIGDQTFDWVHSSHCLEHLQDPRVALGHWLRVLKSGGYLVFTVPDEELYERLHWPSRWTNEHLWSFTIYKPNSSMPRSVNVVDLVREFANQATCERIVLIDDFYQPHLPDIDQTLTICAECAIEVVLKKR